MTGLLVHEWVARAGGSENVLEQFALEFPDADLQVLWNDDPERFSLQTYETWLARTPLRRSKPLSLPFLPLTWRTIRARKEYEWILVSSHLFAHHVKLTGHVAEVPKFSYVHTPARYIWEPDLDDRGQGAVARLASLLLKPVDKRRAQESTKIAANSKFTRERIRRVWDREADVIYPPVETERIIAGGDWRNNISGEELAILEKTPESFLLGASRFVSYKRLDLVIEAGEATGLPVVLAGGGPALPFLREKANEAQVPVIFIDSPSDGMLYALYQRATALIFPAIEDFGIMPVEAMAAGTPVIVPATGGAAESVSLADGGAVADTASRTAWREALDRVTALDRTDLPIRASQFSTRRFRAEVRAWTVPGTLNSRDQTPDVSESGETNR